MKKESLKFALTAEKIDEISDVSVHFMKNEKIAQKDILRYRLSIEEVLLCWMNALAETECTYTISRRFGKVFIELTAQGSQVNPLSEETEDGLTQTGQNILANMGLMPHYFYENGLNKAIFMLKRQHLSMLKKLIIALAAAVVVGFSLTVLPPAIGTSLTAYILTPFYSIFFSVLSLLACPLMFFSVIWGILSIGDTGTLNRVGKVIIQVLGSALVISSCLALLLSLPIISLTKIGAASSGAALDGIVQLLVDIFPKSLFGPFIEVNSMQIVFMAVFFGICILSISQKIPVVVTIIDQFNQLFQYLMGVLCSFMPLIIFTSITSIIYNSNYSELQSALTFVKVFICFIIAEIVIAIGYASFKLHRSPLQLVKAISQSTLIALTTISSTAAFSTAATDTVNNLGVNNTLFKFCFPLGMVVFMPSLSGFLITSSFAFGQSCGISITPTWIITALILAMILSISTPPVPGGALMCFTLMFTQLGIPVSMLPIIITLDTLFIDAFDTCSHIGILELMTAVIAKKLNMLET